MEVAKRPVLTLDTRKQGEMILHVYQNVIFIQTIFFSLIANLCYVSGHSRQLLKFVLSDNLVLDMM
jgi:hypothetical protein